MQVTLTWIPCAERLPDDDERVLIVADGDVWGAAYSTAHDGWWTDDASLLTGPRVTHWSRMPEVPT